MKLRFFLSRCLLIGLCCISSSLAAQEYPQDYFRSPLGIPLRLSGTFGELRTNHFHSGLDIRTGGVEGEPVYATADGFISRIKVSAYGYGNALYIDHPNGFSTVYGHLRNFAEPIQSWAEAKHYEKKSFEIDIPLYADEIPVKKGQIIAYSGNTGGSGGPHLHFEVRHTKTEAVINPKHFGFDVPDAVAPVIDFLELVPYTDQSRVNNSSNKKRFTAIRAGGNSYSISQRLNAYGPFYLQVKAWDKHNGNEFRNGIYSLLLLSGNDTLYRFSADRFEFNETRYANAVMDYQERMLNRQQIYRTYKAAGNLLPLIVQAPDAGIFTVENDQSRAFEMHVTDFNSNKAILKFTVHGASQVTELSSTNNSTQRYFPTQAWQWETEDVRISMPANALYDTIDFTYGSNVKPYATFSAVHSIHNAKVPVHSFYDLSIRHNGLVDSLRPKTVLVNTTISKGRSAAIGKWDGDWFTAKVRGFGDFYLAIDTIQPVISVLSLRPGSNYTTGQTVRFKISDNLAGLQSYTLSLNDQWQKAVFDGKTATLTYTVHENSPKGNLNLKLIVKDAVGNETVYNSKIVIP